MIYDLETARNKDSYTCKYWKKEDSLKYASQLQYFTKVNKLLTLSDEEKLHQKNTHQQKNITTSEAITMKI